MLEVPESHITLGVYSSKRGIGTAKKEEEPIPVWLIVVIAVICLLLMIALVYFFTRKTEATSASTKATV
jgi:flagellar basal body-associated protein FliL